jgi:hypothetical protein
LTRRSEFEKLSEAQKDTIRQILESRNILSSELQGTIQRSEASLQTHLNDQDVLLKQSMQTLSLDISSSMKGSETKTMSRFDAQDIQLKDTAERQLSQAEYMSKVEQDTLRRRLLDALAYPEINERRNMIEGRVGDFGQTYKWIFKTSTRWDHNFVLWLQSGEDIFWISGKPGSGKSSLLAYIYIHLRPDAQGFNLLEDWAYPRTVKLLTFWFFRPAASHLLKSLEGFWRSLCFQILDIDTSLTQKIRVDASAPRTLRSVFVESGSAIRSWTDKELKEWFFYALSQSEFNYCILVDGLDEIEKHTPREMLLDAICEIARSSKRVKVCCSCRPETPFEQELQKYPSLRLQDLNYKDILEDCQGKLAGTLAVEFAEKVAHRAEGVFLWAHLVATDLRAAAQKGDHQKDLIQRLEETPDEMNELFTALLERQDRFYAKNPKPYLALVQASTKIEGLVPSRQPFDLFELLLASHRYEILMPRLASNVEDEFWKDLDAEANHLETNIVVRCAGLVQVYDHKELEYRVIEFPQEFPHKALVRVGKLVARFIHRSVQDFLQENDKAKTLLRSCQMSDDDARLHLTAASALKYVVNNNDLDFVRITGFASLFQSHIQNVHVVQIIDNISATVAERWERSFDTEYRHIFHSVFLASSIDLSLIENTKLILLTMANLYVNTIYYIDHLEPRKRPYAAMVAFLQHISRKYDPPDSTFISELNPRLQMHGKLTVHYEFLGWPCMPILYIGHIWQHIGIAKARANLSKTQRGLDLQLQSALDNIHRVSAIPKEEDMLINCWFFELEDRPMVLTPGPNEMMESVKAELKNCSTFRFNLDVRRSVREQLAVAEVIEWSPPGFESFLRNSGPRFNNIMRFLGGEDGAERRLAVALEKAEMLSKAIALHSPQSVARAIWNGGMSWDACFIFDGEVRVTDGFERGFWEEKLYQGRDYEQHDGITSEIIKVMLADKGRLGRIKKRVSRRK